MIEDTLLSAREPGEARLVFEKGGLWTVVLESYQDCGQRGDL